MPSFDGQVMLMIAEVDLLRYFWVLERDVETNM